MKESSTGSSWAEEYTCTWKYVELVPYCKCNNMTAHFGEEFLLTAEVDGEAVGAFVGKAVGTGFVVGLLG